MQKENKFFFSFPRQSNSDEVKVTKKSVTKDGFWRINARKRMYKGISRQNEEVRLEGSMQIWEDCGKS